MRILIAVLALFFTSCSVQTIGDPKESPSEKETKMINEVLDDLEDGFAQIDVDVDFRSIPIFVVDNPTRGGIDIAGLCRGTGTRIILDKRLFNIPEEEGKISLLWWTLLHELGHCYFKRGHVETLVHAEKSKVFYFKTAQDVPDEFKYVCTLESSVMYPGITMESGLIPEEAKSFYIFEMAKNNNKHESNYTKEVFLSDFDFYTDRDPVVKKGFRLNQDCSLHQTSDF